MTESMQKHRLADLCDADQRKRHADVRRAAANWPQPAALSRQTQLESEPEPPEAETIDGSPVDTEWCLECIDDKDLHICGFGKPQTVVNRTVTGDKRNHIITTMVCGHTLHIVWPPTAVPWSEHDAQPQSQH